MAKKKILIVDDDSEMRLALHIRLKANNYDVGIAVDGVSAIAEARKTMPDLVLLDLGLPAGNGFAVLERMQAIPALSSIPVIVVTGRDRHTNLARAEVAGAAVFLQKPVQNAELLSAINRLLNLPTEPSTTIYDIGDRIRTPA